MMKHWTFSTAVATVCAAMLVSACTKDPAVLKQRHVEKAQGYFAKQQYNEAIIELKNALQIDPNFPPAVLLAGRAYAAKGWLLDGARELRRAVDLQPDNIEARTELGRVSVTLEAWDDALRESTAILEKNPAHTEALYFRAAALSGKGQHEEALTTINKAIAAKAVPQYATLKGDILGRLGRLTEAEQAYRTALEQNPKFAAARVGLAQILLRGSKLDDARAVLEQAKADEPMNPSVRLYLSALLAQKREFEAARKELEALPRQTWTPRVALASGQLDVQAGRYREAATTLGALKQLMPGSPLPRYWLGHALLGLNRPEDALAEFQAVVQKFPDNAIAHLGVALALLQTRQPREALTELKPLGKALEKLPDYHLLLGRTYLALGATDDALKAARTAVALRPQNARAYGLIGTIHTAKGDLRAAQEAFGKAIESDPAFTPGRVGLGYVYNLEKKPEEALKEYEGALAQNPRDQAAVAAKAAMLLDQKKVDEAIATAQAGVKSDPSDPAAHELLGRLYFVKNDLVAADKAFKEALRLDEGHVRTRLTLARLAIVQNKPDDAVGHLQRVLKDHPSDLLAVMMLADLHARQFRYDQARDVLEAAARRTNEPVLALALANVYISAGRFDEAVARLAPLLKENPNAVQPRLLTGKALLIKGDNAGAVAELEAVNRLNPNLAEAHYYLARALLARGDVERSKAEYRRAAELAPAEKQIQVELASVTGGKPDPTLVAGWVEDVKVAVNKNPTNTVLREQLARAYLAQNRPADAEVELKRVLESSPLSPTANRMLGLMRIEQKRPDDAVPFLQAVLRVEPNDPQANLLLAGFYESKGNRDQVLRHLETVHRANPALPGIKLRLAQFYGASGRVPDGIARAREAVASEPKSVAAHVVLGNLYLQNGDVAPAIEVLTAATRLDGNSAPAQFALGNAYERKGEASSALAAYRKAASLAPTASASYNNIAYIYATQRTNLNEALTLALKAQELSPNNAGVLDTLGYVHYQRGDFDKAEPALKKAVELAPNNPTISYHLGMTYYKLGRRDDAAAALRRSLQLKETLPQAAEIRAVLAELRK